MIMNKMSTSLAIIVVIKVKIAKVEPQNNQVKKAENIRLI
jgi:hypothetical protein